ncbi:MAG: peptidylprolyl isomerase [Chthoniobacteraceae bacterium]|jgi:parvulin-like peptidyl-prolyl isomerase
MLPSPRALAAYLCLPLLLLSSAAKADSTIIARVGDTEVTADDIRTAIQNLDAQTQAAAARDPSTLSQVVRAILTQRLVLKEALAKKWDQDPVVTAALDRVRDNVIAQTYIQAVSKPPDSYPSDAEAQAAYDANKSQLVVPRQYELAQVYIKCMKGADDATAAKAQVKLDAVRKALAKRGADFSAIAQAESDEPQSAAKGGELGWIAENRIQPEIRAELGPLAKGSTTQPIRLDDGWHILKVIDAKEPYTPDFDEIRPQLVEKMREQRAREIGQQYIAKLLQQTPIQIDELNLSKIIKTQ